MLGIGRQRYAGAAESEFATGHLLFVVAHFRILSVPLGVGVSALFAAGFPLSDTAEATYNYAYCEYTSDGCKDGDLRASWELIKLLRYRLWRR